MRYRLVPFVLLVSVAALCGQTPTPRKRVTDTYHGVAVADDYRWLEKGDDPAVRAWWEKQNQASTKYLTQLPHLKRLTRQYEKLTEDLPTGYEKVQHAKGVLCALANGVLVVLKSVDDLDDPRILVDPEKWPGGEDAVLDDYFLSPDGKYVAVSISFAGNEEGTLHLFETATGKKLPDSLPQTYSTAGGYVAWHPNGLGFYYLRFPNMKPDIPVSPARYAGREIWYHHLGTPIQKDLYVFGRELPPYSSLGIQVNKDGKYLLIGAASGWTSEESTWYLVPLPGKPELLLRGEDKALAAEFGPGGTLFLESYREAPRGQILRRPVTHGQALKEDVLVPKGTGVIHLWGLADKRLFVLDREDGSERLRTFTLDGKEPTTSTVPPATAVEEIVHLGGDRLLYMAHGPLQPPIWYLHDPATRQTCKTPLSEDWKVKLDDAVVTREWATSRDGTKVPLTLIRRKDCPRDSERPVLLAGYGGFRFHERPTFQVERRIWLDHGGIWAIAHPRGEGELGDHWHHAAVREKKQVSADDFIVCAEYLIAQKYTRPERLAIFGASNGGLLIGMALTQRPELFAAAILDVPVLDMLRSELDAYGPPCKAEYGSVTDPAQFRALYAYSPYHRVQEGTQYPAIWLHTGANDRRVDPKHAWKMAARLQASGTKKPVLLTTGLNQGHNVQTPPYLDLAFFFTHLGVKRAN